MTATLHRLRTEWRMLARVIRLRAFEQDTADGRSRERYRRILLTAASGLGLRAAGAVIGLVTVPLLLGYLGKERYGLWSAITTLVAWAALLDLGIANGLVNLISRAHGRGDREEAARSFSTAVALLVSMAALFAVALALGAFHVPWSSLLAVRGAAADAVVTWAVVAALATFIAGLPLSSVPQIYAGYQKTYLFNLFTLAGVVAAFGGLLLALRAGAGMPVLVVFAGAGTLSGSLLALIYALGWDMPWLRFRAAALSVCSVRELMGRSFPIFLFQVCALGVNETQAIILAHRCNLSLVADYSIVIRVYLTLMGLILHGTQSFAPSLREAFERGEVEWARRAFRRVAFVRVGAATAGGVLLVLLGNPLLRVWLRSSAIAFPVALWVALAVLLVSSAWATVHAELLTVMDRLWVQVALVLGNAVATVALTFWLSRPLGVLGVIVATGAATALCFSWLMPALTRQVLNPR